MDTGKVKKRITTIIKKIKKSRGLIVKLCYNDYMISEKSFQILKKELFSYSAELEKNIKNVFSLIQKHNDSNHEALMKRLIPLFIDYSKQKKATYEKYDIDNELRFNFFESISDKWYRENFHSDILEAILNPKTPEIGRKEFLKEFVSFIGITKEQFDCDSNYMVIKEAPTGKIKWKDDKNKEQEMEGFIDLLIKNDHQAIIIENKINYAKDMENQLVRYMKYVEKDLHITNYTVVYLTLIDDKNKKPPLDSYDKDFEKYKNKLRNKKILKEAFAVDPERSLAKDFIPNCQQFLKNEINRNKKNVLDSTNNIAFVYLEQYKILLNHLGGNAYMSTVDKKIFKEIYSDKELYDLVIDFATIWEEKEVSKRPSDKQLIQRITNEKLLVAAENFMDLWINRRTEPLQAIMLDKFHETYSKIPLEIKKVNGYKIYSWLSSSNDYKIYWDGDFQIGYVSLEGKTLSKTKQKELKNKLINLIGIGMDDIGEYKNQWIWYDVPNNLFSSPNDVIYKLGLLLTAKAE